MSVPDYITSYLAAEWVIERDAPPEFLRIPNAGSNPVPDDATPYQREMILRLNVYEREFMRQCFRGMHEPGLNENDLDYFARIASGLTPSGLVTARGYAGKKASGSPGVFFPKKKTKHDPEKQDSQKPAGQSASGMP